MKFIHTSDWHIGRQFHNVSLLEDQRYVLDQLLSYVVQESVDAVVIAGDVYDRAIPPAAAVALLDDVFTVLCTEMQVPVIVIPGNHDSAQRLSFGARQLSQAGLHILGDLNRVTEPVVINHPDGDVAFYGVPYNDPETVRNMFGEPVSTHDEAHSYLVNQITASMSGDHRNVLMSHCFVSGAQESESERPLSIGGADRVSYQPCIPFDYVALGHLHSPQSQGASHIRYCGSLLKYSFSEQHQKKGVTLVEINAEGVQSNKHLPLLPRRDMRVLEGALNTLIERGKTDPNADDYVLIRLTDRHAILEPMSKLRVVYPNVLQLEKPGMLETGDQRMNHDTLKRGELDMFRDFFQQVSGQPLTDAQDEAIQQTITALHQTEGS